MAVTTNNFWLKNILIKLNWKEYLLGLSDRILMTAPNPTPLPSSQEHLPWQAEFYIAQIDEI